MSEFKIPPISTLSGSTLINYFKILGQGKIAPRFYLKIVLTTIVILIATPFHIWEKIVFKRKLKNFEFKKPPLFILGHWRSGTTLLHNLLSKDPNVGFVTTYQSVFPNNLASKWVFRTFMKRKMPNKRPSDNVELNIDFPQEDEFAFCNMQWNAYYNFFYFPKDYQKFYDAAVHHKNLTAKESAIWYSQYDTLLKKAALDSGGSRLIVKNPVNTARIDKILKLYPEAKFLYIYRNPITVFLSTERFFRKLFPTLWLHKVDKQFIDDMIFNVYKQLMEDYLVLKATIPAENLMELRYEDFESDPVQSLNTIYSTLLNEDFISIKDYFTKYFSTQKKHKKNKYTIDKKTFDRIENHLEKYIKMYNYSLPDDISIK